MRVFDIATSYLYTNCRWEECTSAYMIIFFLTRFSMVCSMAWSSENVSLMMAEWHLRFVARSHAQNTGHVLPLVRIGRLWLIIACIRKPRSTTVS